MSNFSSHRAWTFILQSLGLPFNLLRPQRKYIFGMRFPFSCLISLQLFFRGWKPFLPAKRFIRLTGKSSYDMSDASCHRICLKYSHCHHRNHFYNPRIQSHYPESSPQELASNLGVTLMTETEFLHLQRR